MEGKKLEQIHMKKMFLVLGRKNGTNSLKKMFPGGKNWNKFCIYKFLPPVFFGGIKKVWQILFRFLFPHFFPPKRFITFSILETISSLFVKGFFNIKPCNSIGALSTLAKYFVLNPNVLYNVFTLNFQWNFPSFLPSILYQALWKTYIGFHWI